MEQLKKQFISVGELAKKTGVTVRTLQYYDRTGLLKAAVSEGGRRIYTRDDVLRLQQILFLKSFGFSLEEINEKLLSTKSATDLEKVFSQQREMLLGQIGHLNKIVDLLDTILPELKTGQEISMDKLMIIMELMKQGNPYSFVIRYFGDEQLKNISEQFEAPEKYKKIMTQSEKLLPQLDALYQKGADPAGREGQELAAQWWKMVTDFTSGDPDLLKPLLSAGRDLCNWPKETEKFRDAIQNFLSEALDCYLRGRGIKLSEKEK